MELPPYLYYRNPFTSDIYYTPQGLHISNVISSLILILPHYYFITTLMMRIYN